MTFSSSKPVQFVLHAIIPIMCSLILGVILHGFKIFSRLNPTFDFMVIPTIASIFYYLLIYGKRRDAYASLVVMFLLASLTTGSKSMILILRDVLYFGAIALTIFFYFLYFRGIAHRKIYFTTMTIAGLYTLLYLLAAWMQYGIVTIVGSKNPNPTFLVFTDIIIFMSIPIGFAIGAGFTIADKLFGEPQPEAN